MFLLCGFDDQMRVFAAEVGAKGALGKPFGSLMRSANSRYRRGIRGVTEPTNKPAPMLGLIENTFAAAPAWMGSSHNLGV